MMDKLKTCGKCGNRLIEVKKGLMVCCGCKTEHKPK